MFERKANPQPNYTEMNPVLAFLKSRPVNVICWKIRCKLFNSKMPEISEWLDLFRNKEGIEIGGPSGIFKSTGYLPIYRVVKKLDGVNFDSNNIWSGITEDNLYHYEGRSGNHYILDGVNLQTIQDNRYDFLLSCNNLEHIANPIKAIYEWKRVLKKDGTLLLILPKKESNFDNKRPVTLISHLMKDYENNIAEDDLTHLAEILELHNLKRDPLAGNRKAFEKRARENNRFRALHHHVFDIPLLRQVMDETGFKVLRTHATPTDYFIAASNG